MTKRSRPSAPRDRRLIKLLELFERDDGYEHYWLFDVVRRALWFANSRGDISAEVLKRKLRVLPSKSRYRIDPEGGYLGSARAVPLGPIDDHPRLTLAARRYLVDEFDAVIDGRRRPENSFVQDPELTARNEAPTLVAKRRVPASMIWFGCSVREWRNDHVSQRLVCTPTVDDFVAYAAEVANTDPWRKMLRRCASSECERFFLTPKKRQRPNRTCPGSLSCKAQWEKDRRGISPRRRHE